MSNDWINDRFDIESKKYNIKEIIKRIKGDSVMDLVIPEYQRDYVWNESKEIPMLLTSLYIGYPIGFITIWKDKSQVGGHEFHLIDGLQRHYSIYKIKEKPYNYLHFDMYKHWCKINEVNINEKNDRENFKQITTSLNSKLNNYEKKEFDEVLKEIESTKMLNSETKLNFEKFYEHYKNWYDYSFESIKIPHIMLWDYPSEEVSRIFKLVNTTGKKLNKFEVASANWSHYKISLNKEIKFIKDFQNRRVENYKSYFVNDNLISKNLINYNNSKIIPSNFIYAVFEEAIKEIDVIYNSFYKKAGTSKILNSKSIEAVTEIVKSSLISNFKIDYNFEIEELGKELQKYIKTEEDVNNIVKKIKTKTNIATIDNIPIISAFKLSNQKKVTHPSWLLAAFIIHAINGANSNDMKHYNNWFLYEMLLSSEYNSSTGNNAKKIIDNKKYNKEFNLLNQKDFLNEAKKIMSEQSNNYEKNQKISNKIKIILSIMQQKDFSDFSSSFHIDHLLPQSVLKKINNFNFNTIYDLQYMKEPENKEKGDKLNKDQHKYDFFYKLMSEDDKKTYNENLKIIVENIDNINNYKENVINLLELRKGAMHNSLKIYIDSHFLKEN